MLRVRSRDGTSIAFDRLGGGPAVILVGGEFSDRAFPKLVQLSELLSERFTVINYDRRGRGASGDTAPYAVEREIEDLGALIDRAGGSASVCGWSCGAVLALRAAAAGLEIERLALYEPPFVVDGGGHLPPADFAARLEQLIAADRRGAAVRHFMTKGMGVPAIVVALIRFSPLWSRLKATAHTLPYDRAVMGDTLEGRPLASEEWASVSMPTLALTAERSPAQQRRATRALAEVLPNQRQRTLKGQGHDVSIKVMAAVLAEFLAPPRHGGGPLSSVGSADRPAAGRPTGRSPSRSGPPW